LNRTRLAATSLLALMVAGCSVLLNTAEPTQCTTDRDCDANPSFRGRICDQGFCVIPKAAPTPVSNDSGSGCVSTDLCTQANSGKASVCKAGGACTPWQNARCPYISGEWKNPDAVIVGSIQPLTVKQVDGTTRPSAYADRIKRAIDLGVKDFTTISPGGQFMPDQKRRPIAVLHCDSELSPEGAQAAFQHLTDVVRSPAIILGADEDLAAIAADATTKEVAIACSDCVAPFPAGPLVWRIGPRIALEAPLAAWRVSQLETEIKARVTPPPPTTLKVGVLTTPGRATEDFYNALAPKLHFNGKTVTQNGASFVVVQTPNPLLQSVDHKLYADQVIAAEPDVLVVLMTSDFPTYYLPLIEQGWPAGKAKPHYVVSALSFSATAFGGVLSDDDRRKRVSGTRPAFSTALQDNITAFETRYVRENNFLQPDGNSTGFEAFYSMALAIMAARTQPLLDGPHISAGFERLRGGAAPLDFRPENLGLAIGLLSQPSVKIDARGLLSTLDWNVTSRDLESDASMFCFVRDPDGNLVIHPDAGPHLTTATGVVDGTYACP